ncbi:hypothetical protein ABT263_24960 [Kitasatospora sp. NPDC001603]|uniref:hypothetical protein n=1 Tax=Kitasatospora sp. NPDC001603 TaxID=3154388 RepID=UPI00331A1543
MSTVERTAEPAVRTGLTGSAGSAAGAAPLNPPATVRPAPARRLPPPGLVPTTARFPSQPPEKDPIYANDHLAHAARLRDPQCRAGRRAAAMTGLMLPVALSGASTAGFFLAAARVGRLRRLVADRDRTIADLDRAVADRDKAVDDLASASMPSLLTSARAAAASVPQVPMVPGLEGTAFHQGLHVLLEEFAKALRSVEYESGLAFDAQGREVTAAAVTSVATSVVSLVSDVSRLIGEAMRRHSSDEVYATLSEIDHAVQQVLRQGQAFLVVHGGVPGRRWPAQSLTDVVRGAIGRVREFDRVRHQELPYELTGRAVEPVVHSIATLLDNALRYSPPGSVVEVGFLIGHHGVAVVVDDAGLRMNPEQLAQANAVLSGHQRVDVHRLGPTPAIGFPSIAVLAARYGFSATVEAPNAYGGTRGLLFIPHNLLAAPAVTTEPVSQPEPAGSSGLTPAPPAPAATPGGLPRRVRHDPALVPRQASALSTSPPSAAPITAWASTVRRDLDPTTPWEETR